MKKSLILILILTLFINSNTFAITLPSQEAENINLDWVAFSDKVFDQAKKENKLVILDLEAVWCHWCHVMKTTTYNDPQIKKILQDHYITVRVDQDSRPDLSNKYKDYGWPATIFFNSKGEEIVKRSGYITPDDMKLLLEKIVQDPSPEEPTLDLSKIRFSSKPELSPDLKAQLLKMHLDSFDDKLGGLNIPQKFLDRDSVEYSLLNVNNQTEKQMAVKTLIAGLMLIDPVWGGVYQYSTMGGWNYPHFEKLATIQGEYLRIYSEAYSTLKDPVYLMASEDIHKYIKDFLTSEKGAFYTSQDADLVEGEHSGEYYLLNDSDRRKFGIPKIDKNIYSSQNGLIINGLVALYNADQNKEYLNESIKATKWIVKNRAVKPSIKRTLEWIFEDISSVDTITTRIKWIISNKAWPERGYYHSEKDGAGPYLNDTLNMGKAFLSLYEATKNKKWLVRAEQSARFIKRNFQAPIAGFATSKSSCEICAVRNPDILTEENIELVRFASKLYKNTHEEDFRFIAEHSMKYLATKEIATRNITEPGILIAEEELKKTFNN